MQTLVEAVLCSLYNREGCQFTGCCADLPAAVISLRYPCRAFLQYICRDAALSV